MIEAGASLPWTCFAVHVMTDVLGKTSENFSCAHRTTQKVLPRMSVIATVCVRVLPRERKRAEVKHAHWPVPRRVRTGSEVVARSHLVW